MGLRSTTVDEANDREFFCMRRFAIIASTLLPLAANAASAQDDQPYAGLETRAIKALSADEIADLSAGRGMGLALAAELNGYPGPRHVLELAEPLKLSPAQRAGVGRLFAAMQAEAVALGERLIGQEAELDKRFADGTITVASLNDLTEAIGETQAELRAAHLRYHVLTKEALGAQQVHRYNELRGYVSMQPGPHEHRGH
jgi:hypothetical protein